MKKYEILPHTADVIIKVFGKTKKELFSNALSGMTDILRAEEKSQKFESRKIKVKSADFATLLVDFLNEVLYLTQINKEIYTRVEFKKFSNTNIEGNLTGQKVKRFGEDIKAATYHNIEICKIKDGTWEVEIVFDI